MVVAEVISDDALNVDNSTEANQIDVVWEAQPCRVLFLYHCNPFGYLSLLFHEVIEIFVMAVATTGHRCSLFSRKPLAVTTIRESNRQTRLERARG